MENNLQAVLESSNFVVGIILNRNETISKHDSGSIEKKYRNANCP